MIRNIKIVGGIHNNGHFAPHEVTEEVLEKMANEIASIISKHTRMDSYMYFKFEKEIGGKINS